MPVAVVTGSNKGIGLGIVRALCKQFKAVLSQIVEFDQILKMLGFRKCVEH